MGCPRVKSTSIHFRVLLGCLLAFIFAGASLAADPLGKGGVIVS